MAERNREEILASDTPLALFGVDATRDPRALRRAYAALIRVYGPDDDAETFAHIRQLYEEARRAPPPDPEPPARTDVDRPASLEDDRAPEVESYAPKLTEAPNEGSAGDPIAPLLDSADGPSFDPPPSLGSLPPATEAPHLGEPIEPAPADRTVEARRVRERLSELLSQREWDAVNEVLDTQEGYLREDEPELWLDAVWGSTEAQVFDLPDPVLRRRLLALDSVGAHVDLAPLQEVEELLHMGLSFHQAVKDTDADDRLLTAIRRAWNLDDYRAAEVWLEYGTIMGDDPELPERILYLRHFHPGVYRAFSQIDARVSGSAMMHRLWLANQLPKIAVRGATSRYLVPLRPSFWESFVQLDFQSVSMGIVRYAIHFCCVILVLEAFWFYGWFIGLWAFVSYAAAFYLVIRKAERMQKKNRWNPNVRTGLVTFLRQRSLWPHEVVAVMMPKDRDDNYAPATLVAVEQDASLTLSGMTTRHLDRVRERVEGTAR